MILMLQPWETEDNVHKQYDRQRAKAEHLERHGIPQPLARIATAPASYRIENSGKSKWGLSKWGLKVVVHNCPRLPTIVVIL